jgi:DNA-directed RNA polymerase subunit RPC12/RpoP
MIELRECSMCGARVIEDELTELDQGYAICPTCQENFLLI